MEIEQGGNLALSEAPAAAQVRRAQPSDMDWITGELRAFDRFYGSTKSLFGNAEYVRTTLEALIAQHVFLIAERDGNRMGFIAGLLTPHFFNPELKVLTEMLWWVPPAHRGSRAGLLLLNEYIRIGEESADWILMTLEDRSPIAERSLIKRGFHLKERSFLMEVN